MTQDEQVRFWLACGWKNIRFMKGCSQMKSGYAGINSNGNEGWLPNPSDLNAVFEGLEWRAKQFADDRMRRWSLTRDTAGGYTFQLAWSWTGTGVTPQDAIMKAVLQWIESQQKRDDGKSIRN